MDRRTLSVVSHFASLKFLFLCFAALPASAQTCVDAAGTWNVNEAGSITCSADGETETFSLMKHVR